MPDFKEYFATLYSDIEVAGDSIFVVQETNRFAWENRDRLNPSYQDDQFLIRNIRAHKVTAIITLHKIYDNGGGTKSIDHLLQWVYRNIGEFSKERLIQRRVLQGQPLESAEDYASDVRDMTIENIRELADFKRSFQGKYDREVRNLRNWAFAHRPVGIDASELSVDHNTLEELVCAAKGIYESVWQAWFNGRSLSVESIEYCDPWDLKESISSYFQKYIREPGR